MSKGNINYKYLRRRKNWFRRNLPLVIICAVAVIILVTAIIFGVIFVTNHVGKKSSQSETKETVTEEETREVVWIDDVEKETKKVSYTVPENAAYPYFIKVNRALNCVTVYGIDNDGKYTIPVKAFACSCGKKGYETILGESMSTGTHTESRYISSGNYGKYIIDISGTYLFQSVPYTSSKHDSLVTEEYNKLGESATTGAIIMSCGDIKWIYDNCKAGTKVTIYDDSTTPGPLGKPETIKIPVDSKNALWDPTDPDSANPWQTESAKIKGTSDITTKIGEKVDLLKGVTATDTCGNDITSKIVTIGHYTFDQEGTYDIKYKVTDAIGSSKEVTVKLNVVK